MQKVMNHLIQLQELVLVREQEAFMGGARLQQLDKSIKSFTEQLPDGVQNIFLRLQKKDPVAVVPVSNGGCSICGMRLPISLVQSVRALKHIQHCPNCARILYYSDSHPRSVAKKQSRIEPRKVGIERFSSEDLMVPRMAATTRDEALHELAAKMAESGFIEHPGKLVEEALRREAIISTAVDHGVAFPHVRSVEGGGLTFALGMSPTGIRFNESEKDLTNFVFFIVIPTAANAFYLRLLAGLTEVLMVDEFRQTLLADDEPKKLWRTLRKLTKKSIP